MESQHITGSSLNISNNMSNQPAINKKYKSIAFLISILVISIAISWISTKFSMVMDVTQNSRHSLSQTSINLLRQINGEISVTAYAGTDPELRNAIRQFIGKYQTIKPDIRLEFVDPGLSPDKVRELGIRINGELVFQYQDRIEHVRSADENTIINALARLWKGEEQWIVYLTGHGERDLLGLANHDLGSFGSHLKNRGYIVQPLNLSEIGAIPDNTAILVIAGLQSPFFETERTMLLEYIERGGNVICFVDPGGEDRLPTALLDFLEIEIGKGTILDTAGQLIGIDDPTITIITSSLYGPHPLLEDFTYTTIFPHATAIFPGDSQLWTTMPLLMTGNQAWLETSPLGSEAAYDPETDLQGPLTIGLSLNRQLTDSRAGTDLNFDQRIIVLGDGDFLSNTYIENSGNLELGMRIFSWLAHQEDLITIPVRATKDTHLTVSTTTIGALGILFLVVLPLLSLSFAIFLWWKIRNN